MNTQATVALSRNRQHEDSKYSLSATLDHYEVEELSTSQMARRLHKMEQNPSKTPVSAGTALGAGSI